MDWCQHLGLLGQPLDSRTIGPYVRDISGALPGNGWVKRFLARHKEVLRHCRSSALDPKRARSFNYPVVQDYFEKLQAVIMTHDIPVENIYNMDEKGCQLGGGRKGRRKKYLFGRQNRDRYRVHDGNLELITVVECVSADGFALKPYIIFKGKQLRADWYHARGALRASEWAPTMSYNSQTYTDAWFPSSIGVSQNGWIDNEHCSKWIERSFIPQVTERNASGKPILLLCDGHGSHCTGKLLHEAHKHNIFVMKLPPHCTHKLQPLDVGILGPLQNNFTNKAVHESIRK